MHQEFHMGSKTIRLLPALFNVFPPKFYIRIESQFNRPSSKENRRISFEQYEIQDSTSIEQLWQHTQSIFDDMKPVVYFNIILPLFAMMYNKLLSNQLKKSNIDIRNIDLSHIRTNALEYSPHTALHNLNAKYFNQDSIESYSI
ncbi:MAG: hypothetical protein MZU95_16040 [Desulfomicrobium escambiense]|nr:hypothetical protein [Desulfomicrobium escambiense]